MDDGRADQQDKPMILINQTMVARAQPIHACITR